MPLINDQYPVTSQTCHWSLGIDDLPAILSGAPRTKDVSLYWLPLGTSKWLAPGIFTFFLNHARSSSSHSCSQSVIAPLPSSRYATVNKPSAEPDRSSWRATVYRMYIYSAQRPDLGTPGQ